MNKKQPYLTGFSSHLFGSAKKSTQAIFQAKVAQFKAATISGLSMIFEDILPSTLLHELSSSPRKRIYDEPTTLWAWCSQILEGNASCHKAVSHVQAWREQIGLPAPSSETKAYCDARNRLSKNFIEQANNYVLNNLERSITPRDTWNGLTLKAIDGSSLQLMDTPENQLKYPQPSEQKKGCGFPVIGICGVVNLSHGGWEAMTTSVHTQHDSRSTYSVLERFGEKDLCLADRAYNSYEFVTLLKLQGCASLMRLHHARKRSLDWKKGKKLGDNDRLQQWVKPKAKPPGSQLTKEEWILLPETLMMRIVRFKYETREGKTAWMYLATTLLDPNIYSYDELCKLYLERWIIELKFRDIKTMLNMDFVRAKTPSLSEKTILVMQLAYNLIYSLIQKASHEHCVSQHRISFKRCIDQVLSNRSNFKGHHLHPYKRQDLRERLLQKLADETLQIRQGRHEPRARKRRPKRYQLLTSPRHVFREIHHRDTYRKPA